MPTLTSHTHDLGYEYFTDEEGYIYTEHSAVLDRNKNYKQVFVPGDANSDIISDWIDALLNEDINQVEGELIYKHKEFTHGIGANLYTVGYCCLGVLGCRIIGTEMFSADELAAEDEIGSHSDRLLRAEFMGYPVQDQHESAILSIPMVVECGMPHVKYIEHPHGVDFHKLGAPSKYENTFIQTVYYECALAKANDAGMTFAQIADVLHRTIGCPACNTVISDPVKALRHYHYSPSCQTHKTVLFCQGGGWATQ